jgi:predicted Fe-S protein YdhL (DUF1289 family)
MASNSQQSVRTPCVGICSTVFGDNVCRGCKRYSHEVIAWNSYNYDQKTAVERRLDSLLEQIMSGKFRLLDIELLCHRIQQQGIRSRSTHNPWCWLFELLRAGAGQIGKPEEYGFALLAPFRDTPLVDLRDLIDDELFLLSEAHYQRYFGVSQLLPEE